MISIFNQEKETITMLDANEINNTTEWKTMECK